MKADAVMALPLSSPVTGNRPSTPELTRGLDREQKGLLALWLACGVTAVAFPHPYTKFVVAMVLGVGYLRASFSQPHLALSGFILMLPFLDIAYKGSIFVSGFNLQTLFVSYLLLLGAMRTSTEAPQHPNPVAAPLASLVVLMVSSALIVATTSNASVVELLTGIKNSFAYATLMWTASRLVTDPRHKLMIAICLMVAVLVNVVFSLREVSLTLALSLSFMRHRATSLISTQPNLYAGFLSLYLFLFIAFLMYYPSRLIYKLWLAGATCLVLMNLVYTMSRGAWLACIIAALYVTGTKSRRLLVPFALVGLLIYFWAPDMVAERWDSSFQGQYDPTLLLQEEGSEAEEAAARIVQWRSFMPMMAESPIFGVGYGQYGPFFKSGGYFPRAKSAHSTIIELGVELGIIGLILYLWTLTAIYRSASRVFKSAEHPIDRVLGLTLLAATVCLVLLDLSGTRFRSGEIMAYYWILVGLTLNALRPRADQMVPAPLSVAEVTQQT